MIVDVYPRREFRYENSMQSVLPYLSTFFHLLVWVILWHKTIVSNTDFVDTYIIRMMLSLTMCFKLLSSKYVITKSMQGYEFRVLNKVKLRWILTSVGVVIQTLF